MEDTTQLEKSTEGGSQHPLALHLLSALQSISACEYAPPIDLCSDAEAGLYCGVEDIGCANRYDGASYGYARGVERGIEWASEAAGHAIETMPAAWCGVDRLPEEGEWVLHTYYGARAPEYGLFSKGIFRRRGGPESFPTSHWLRIPFIGGAMDGYDSLQNAKGDAPGAKEKPML